MDEKEGKVNIFEETMAHLTYVEIEKAAAERSSDSLSGWSD